MITKFQKSLNKIPSLTNSSRTFTTLDPKTIRLNIVKEQKEKKLNREIEAKLKTQKKQEVERESRKKQVEEQKAKTKLAKQKATDAIRSAKKTQTEKLQKKLRAQKLSNWAKEKKQQQKDHLHEVANKEVKRKLKKNAGRPQRAKNTYMWFYTKNFKQLSNEIKGKDGKVSIKAVAGLCKQKFGQLTEDEKKQYQILAEQDKLRYSTERKKFVAHRKAHVVITPFIRFSNEVRASVRKEHANTKITEISKIIGKMWKNLDAGKKEKYTEAFKTEMAAKK